jgi:hypothetical protein
MTNQEHDALVQVKNLAEALDSANQTNQAMGKRLKEQEARIAELESLQTWQPIETAPENTKLIMWVSTDKGFEDTTANAYVFKGDWYWECDTKVKRPDLIKGWMFYPQPADNVATTEGE